MDTLLDTTPAWAIGPAVTGFALAFGLIVAIGAQNAFVLRQGLRREHVVPVIAFCVVADILLMGAGIAGLAPLLAAHPGIARAAAVVGIAFLSWHAVAAARRSWRPAAGLIASPRHNAVPLAAAMAQVAAFTFLNPHTYLDTVVLVGSVGAQHPGTDKWVFLAGASLASAVWFSGLGFGARWLAPWFSRPLAWRVLDGAIALTMVGIAAMLAWQLLLPAHPLSA